MEICSKKRRKNRNSLWTYNSMAQFILVRLIVYCPTAVSILVSVLDYLNIPDSKENASIIVTLAALNDLDQYEIAGRQLLEQIGVIERIPQKLTARTEITYRQIRKYLVGNSVLDLGCGDGNIGKILASRDNLEVALADVYKHDNIRNIGLFFYRIATNGIIPTNRQYDASLLLTVLHHANNPIKTLQEAKRVTKKDGRIIVIESVYGIQDSSPFGQLSQEEQRLANIFFDHFYNRIVHYSEEKEHKVNVPFNFNTPEQWKSIFKLYGLEEIAYETLGIDQPIVPEYHTLHVLVRL
ncbi:methyltransferase domain-containing protein [Candidatus Woesearchaeota archaeon]|nr:methyltransferase domain-containing protein [Candidatus Woesearchaeota archaeon]